MSISQSESKIILDHQQLQDRVRQLQQSGKTVVFTNGCFDLLHVGHIRYLQGAAREGDVLLVALNADEAIVRLKGKGRPIIPLTERLEIISAIECVDLVTSFDTDKCEGLLLLLKPDVHAKGTDYKTPAGVPEYETVMGYGGRVAIVGDPKDHSSTNLIQKLEKK